jgi:hypothetical protein
MGWCGGSCLGGWVPCLLGFSEFRFAEYRPCNRALAGAVILLGIRLIGVASQPASGKGRREGRISFRYRNRLPRIGAR